MKRFWQEAHRAGNKRTYLNAGGGRFLGALSDEGEPASTLGSTRKVEAALQP